MTGKAVNGAHDLLFVIPGCKETVLLTYARDRYGEVDGAQLRRDQNLKRFQKYTSSTYESRSNNFCMECMKYDDIEATLTGKLEVATIPPNTTTDPLGFVRDASGKVVGTAGWGHPVPFARYRLTIESVSKVTAKKLPRPAV